MTASNISKKYHKTIVKTMFRAMVRVGASPTNIVKDTEFMHSWNSVHYAIRARLLQLAPEEYQLAMNDGTLLAQRMWLSEENSVSAALADRDMMERWYRLGRARQDDLLSDAPEKWRMFLNMDAIHERVWRDDDVEFFRAMIVDQYTKHSTEEELEATVRLLEEMIATHSAPRCVRCLWVSSQEEKDNEDFSVDLIRLAMKYCDWPTLLLYLGTVTHDLNNKVRRYDLVTNMSVLEAHLLQLEQTDPSMHRFLLGARKGYLDAIASMKDLPFDKHSGVYCDPTQSFEYTLFRDRVW